MTLTACSRSTPSCEPLSPCSGSRATRLSAGAGRVDAENSRFLRRLAIASEELAQLNAPERAPAPEAEAPEAVPHRLRIIARLGEDGRVEHGVELASGEQILPSMRFLPTSAAVDQWRISSDVVVGESAIGQIRARRLADGRIELGFRDINGEAGESGHPLPAGAAPDRGVAPQWRDRGPRPLRQPVAEEAAEEEASE